MPLEPFPYNVNLSGDQTAQAAWDTITDIQTSDYARFIHQTSDPGFWFEHERGFVLAEPLAPGEDIYDVGQAHLAALESAPDRYTRPAVALQRTDPTGQSSSEWGFYGWIETEA